MSLFQKLQKRAEQNKPVRVGLIGAGKFGSMYLSQVPQTPGVSVAGVVDLSPSRARSNLLKVGWSESNISSTSLDDAIRDGTTYVSDDWEGHPLRKNFKEPDYYHGMPVPKDKSYWE